MGGEDEVGDYAFDLGANRIQFKGTSKVNNCIFFLTLNLKNSLCNRHSICITLFVSLRASRITSNQQSL